MRDFSCLGKPPRRATSEGRWYDNKLALNAGWDKDLLAEELQALLADDLGFDIGITGFSIPDRRADRGADAGGARQSRGRLAARGRAGALPAAMSGSSGRTG